MADDDLIRSLDAVPLETLRTRRSAKWRVYPDDILPAWVAEMDFPLAAPVARALHEAVDRDDAGYAFPGELGAAFSRWAAARWGWEVAQEDVRLVADVVTGLAEILRVATAPGDGVVIEPPVYPPFAATIRGTGRTVVEAPLARGAGAGGRWAPDLSAIARAYEGGARAHVLCSPHNPTGIVYPREDLAEIAALAARHGVLVLADEIHAPLTLPGATHYPFLGVSAEAARVGIVLTSASKAWNVAGLKAAMMIATSEPTRAVLGRLPGELPYHAGNLGVVAACAALREGGPWLQAVVTLLDRHRTRLTELLAASLPSIRYVPPQAGYLTWLDCSALGLGDDPARRFLERGRLALSPGPNFGTQGKGFARLNIGTTSALIEEAVRRMRRSVA